MLQVKDLMAINKDIPYVVEHTSLLEAIEMMLRKGLGMVSIVDTDMLLKGILTDGDLRRIIERHLDLYTVNVDDVMTINPKQCLPDWLAVDALKFIKQHQINNLPVTDEKGCLCGTITWQMIVRSGIVL